MTAPRIYPREVVEDVRRRIEQGQTIRFVAQFHGMSPSTVSTMSRGLIYSDKPRQRRHSKEHLDSIRDLSTTRAERIREAKQAERAQLARTSTLVEQAKSERDSGRPLVVETLDARLQRELPGATCRLERHSGVDAWVVRRGAGSRVSDGPTQREAIDRAICLRGAR